MNCQSIVDVFKAVLTDACAGLLGIVQGESMEYIDTRNRGANV